jgi:cytoskeletal protein CcmA (bactofilin family)
MFKKRETDMEETKMEGFQKKHVDGSKLTGDITIAYDLELDGDVEGSITSEQKSNVVIKGNCKGNITTKEGNVDIEGQMSNGDIIAGGNVKITGKFTGGKIDAKGKITVNGEFHGKLEGNDVEIGPNARGKGELAYKESVSIARGAKIEAQISRVNGVQKDTKKPSDMKVVNLGSSPVKETKQA